jgi:hypothetical protein
VACCHSACIGACRGTIFSIGAPAPTIWPGCPTIEVTTPSTGARISIARLLGLELQDIYGIGPRMEQRLRRAGILTVGRLWNATPFQLRHVWGGINGVLFHQMLHGVDIQPPSRCASLFASFSLSFFKKHRPSACAGARPAHQKRRA